MKRLDFTRQTRKTFLRSKDPSDLVMMLAQITLERRRLEQERVSLHKRLRRIDGRLNAIAGAETKLVPSIQATTQSGNGSSTAERSPLPARETVNLDTIPELVLQY